MLKTFEYNTKEHNITEINIFYCWFLFILRAFSDRTQWLETDFQNIDTRFSFLKK